MYEIRFEIVAIVLLITLYIINLIFYNYPTRTTRIFKQLILICIGASASNLLSVHTFHYTYNNFLIFVNYIIAITNVLGCNTLAMPYYQLMVSITHDQRHFQKKEILISVIPYAFTVLCIFTSPFTKLFFYFDKAGNYCHGPLFGFLFIFSFFYLVMSEIELFKNRKFVTTKQIVISNLYTTFIIGACIFQYLFPNVLIIGITIAISVFLISYAIKNPLQLYDARLEMYTRDTFKEALICQKILTDESAIILLRLKHPETIKHQFGVDNGNYVLKQCVQTISKECLQSTGYTIFDDTLLFICDSVYDAERKLKVYNRYKKTPLIVKTGKNEWDTQPYTVQTYDYILRDMSLLEIIQNRLDNTLTADFVVDFFHYVVTNYFPKDDSTPVIIDAKKMAAYKEQVKIHEQVTKAIEDESFEIHLQPIYDIDKDRFVSAEALLRLKDEKGNYIPPMDYIPYAEANGSIVKIGEIALKKTCDFIRKGNLKELGINKVNVNLSMIQCMQDDIAQQLVTILDSYNIPKDMITFEITETMMTSNPERLTNLMTELKKLNIDFALDDYGVGYSNTSRLLNFPFSEIKFDKSFIDSSLEDKKNAIPLNHLMSMVKDFGLVALNEGVETKEGVDLIAGFGGHLIQGFYYAKPMPLKEFVEFIKEKNN